MLEPQITCDLSVSVCWREESGSGLLDSNGDEGAQTDRQTDSNTTTELSVTQQSGWGFMARAPEWTFRQTGSETVTTH